MYWKHCGYISFKEVLLRAYMCMHHCNLIFKRWKPSQWSYPQTLDSSAITALVQPHLSLEMSLQQF